MYSFLIQLNLWTQKFILINTIILTRKINALNLSCNSLQLQAIILYTFMAALILCWYLIDTCIENYTNVICTARIFGNELFKIPLEWHSILIEVEINLYNWIILFFKGPMDVLLWIRPNSFVGNE